MVKSSVAVIVLNWNDADLLPKSVGSLFGQSEKCDIVIVDNGSEDGSKEAIESFGDKVTALYNTANLGFAGGVNTGIEWAIEEGYEYIALLNNDATADKDWLKELKKAFSSSSKVGGTTCSLLHEDGKTYDSTGDTYSTWGLPYPRGRDEKVSGQYSEEKDVFGISGGASMYRASFFKDVGLFDKDFFAYYEDVDLCFRGQLAGWNFRYAPKAIVYHATGTTSGRIKGFATHQTLKNLPWLFWKNVPLGLFPTILPRFIIAHKLFALRALSRGHIWLMFKALFISLVLMPKKLIQRRSIQKNKQVSDEYIKSILTWDLPPNAAALRKLRSKWWKLRGRA